MEKRMVVAEEASSEGQQKPRILQMVTKMRAEGAPDARIRSTLCQLGLSENQINAILKVAEKDEYSRLRGEMAQSVREELERNKSFLEGMVSTAVRNEIRTIEEKVVDATDRRMAEFARNVNARVDSLSESTKKFREENIKLTEDVRSLEVDIGDLQAGPQGQRALLSLALLGLGVLMLLFSTWSALDIIPRALDLMSGEAYATADGLMGAVMVELGIILAGITLVAAGIHMRRKSNSS